MCYPALIWTIQSESRLASSVVDHNHLSKECICAFILLPVLQYFVAQLPKPDEESVRFIKFTESWQSCSVISAFSRAKFFQTNGVKNDLEHFQQLMSYNLTQLW